jgi:GTPase SAR1 family protein
VLRLRCLGLSRPFWVAILNRALEFPQPGRSCAQVWHPAGQDRLHAFRALFFRRAQARDSLTLCGCFVASLYGVYFLDDTVLLQGVLLVYDVTNRSSFDSIGTWVGEIERHAGRTINRVLLGNKCDVDDSSRVGACLHRFRSNVGSRHLLTSPGLDARMQAVTHAEGESLAREHGMAFFETSAKEDIGVSEAFTSLMRQVVAQLADAPMPPPQCLVQ